MPGKVGPGGGYVKRRRGRKVAAILVAGICAMVAFLVAADYWSNSGRILDGVTVAGVDLGGKTPEEARGAIKDLIVERVSETQVTGGPREVAVTGAEIGVVYDAEATADEAYAIGHEGNIFERLAGRARVLTGGAEVEPDIRYDENLLEKEVNEIAALVDQEPREATARIEGAQAVVGESREGYRVDVPATVFEVERAVRGATGEAPLIGNPTEPAVNTEEARAAAAKAERAMGEGALITARDQRWELTPEEIGQAVSFMPRRETIEVGIDEEALGEVLADVREDLTVEPVEADLEVRGEGFSVVPSETGLDLDEKKLFDDLQAGLLEDRREYEASVKVTEPEITTAEARGMMPTELLGDYRTDYTLTSDQSEERVENLEIASGAVDTTVLAPGETFSMNGTVSSLDYNETKVIINGAETKADGGGLCQVTSTLYMAANYAGLDVTERHPHASQLPYIRPGLDATVWFGDINGQPLDMKFENTTDAFVMLREYVSEDGYVYAEIWGQPNGTSVEMSSRPTMMSDEQSKWTTYQKVTRNGEVVYDGVLHRDVYDVLIDEKGKKIPLPEVNVPPVDP